MLGGLGLLLPKTWGCSLLPFGPAFVFGFLLALSSLLPLRAAGLGCQLPDSAFPFPEKESLVGVLLFVGAIVCRCFRANARADPLCLSCHHISKWCEIFILYKKEVRVAKFLSQERRESQDTCPCRTQVRIAPGSVIVYILPWEDLDLGPRIGFRNS